MAQGEHEGVKEPPPGAHVVEVTARRELPVISLDSGVTKTVVLEPPYRVRLLGRDGQAMAGLSCKVAVGSASHAITSDGQGWIELSVGQASPRTPRVPRMTLTVEAST